MTALKRGTAFQVQRYKTLKTRCAGKLHDKSRENSILNIELLTRFELT